MGYANGPDLYIGGGMMIREGTIETALRQDNPDAPQDKLALVSALIKELAPIALGGSGSIVGTAAILVSLIHELRGRVASGDLDTELAAMRDREPDLPEKLASLETGLRDLEALLASRERPERMTGSGLGSPLPPEQAAALLDALSGTADLADWAGDVARPAALAERLGVARSTVDSWRQQDVVVALPRGRRAHVYPLEQFSGGRPLSGIASVVRAAHGNHSAAWLWLRTPHIDFAGGTPLAALRDGEASAVAAAAERSLA